MLIKRRKSWEMPERLATPESVFLNRRALIKGAGAIAAAAFVGGCDDMVTSARAQDGNDPSAGLYPVARNDRFQLDRALTDEETASTYNNFYEFGSHKRIYEAAQSLPIRPWDIVIDGEVEAPRTIAFDDLIAQMPLEERLYRHRCVEAWSMAVPWSGFPMRSLVEFAKPLGSAGYVRMETFMNPEIAPGQRQSWYPWPYVEGLTIAEATHDLAFLVTGVYGKPAKRQFGAPLRLALPWKYGFKSIKSIVRFTFTRERPVSFWQEIQGSEYGFWANVNPQVPHPRWSQATEEVLGTGERVPTLLFNGYADEVASLYANLTDEPIYF